MTKHVIVFSTKGGVGKSTFVRYFSMVLTRERKRFSVVNLDQQEHVETVTNEDSHFVIYDTAGVYSESVKSLLAAAKDVNSVIIVPIGLGRNDALEVRFITQKLEELDLLDKTFFAFNKIRNVSSLLLKSRKDGLKAFGLNVASSSIRLLDDIADHKDTAKTRSEFGKLFTEVMKKS